MTKQASHNIVFSSGRPGAGQTTAAAHAAVALLRLGYSVGTIDADGDGLGLSLWRDRRQAEGRALPVMPHHTADTEIALQAALADLTECSFIVIDAGPDRRSPAHMHADTLVSVMGPGLEDFSLLAAGNGPSPYTLMVEESGVARVMKGGGPPHWIVMRNRLPSPSLPEAGAERLAALAGSFGFQPLDGFAERPLLAAAMARGQTVLDMKEDRMKALSIAALAARQDVRTLVCAIAPERIRGRVRPLGSKAEARKAGIS